AGFSHVATILAERVTNLADSAIAIVGIDVKQNRNSAGTIALERKFFVIYPGQFAGTTLDGPLDVIGGHVLGLGCGDRGAQSRISVGIAAILRSNADFLDQAGKNLSRVCLKSCLFFVECCPFLVVRHWY